jgi:hypothetical protein
MSVLTSFTGLFCVNFKFKQSVKQSASSGSSSTGSSTGTNASTNTTNTSDSTSSSSSSSTTSSTWHHFYIENNPRVCGTVARTPNVFLANYIALAFSIGKASCLTNGICPKWYQDQNSILPWLAYVENLIATTGDFPIPSINYDRMYNKSLYNGIAFNPNNTLGQENFFIGKNLNYLSAVTIAKEYRIYREKVGHMEPFKFSALHDYRKSIKKTKRPRESV